MTPLVLTLAIAAAAPAPNGGPCPACSARFAFDGALRRVVLDGMQSSLADVTHVATGDLDEDGRADTIAAGGSTYTVLSLADGTFLPGPTLLPLNGTHAVGLADMDGDGHLDVVAGGNAVQVVRGNGLGGFLTPSPAVTPSAPVVDLAVADFDVDGRPDVAVVFGNGAPHSVTIYRGTGGGGLALL